MRTLPDNLETSVLNAILWSVVFILLALWSLAAWAFHSVAAWAVSNAGALAPGSGAIASLQVPPWLERLVPLGIAPEFTAILTGFIPAIEGALGQAPALMGGLSLAVWAVWGIGSALLVVLALMCRGLIGKWMH